VSDQDWRLELRPRLAPLALTPVREAEIVDELAAHLDDRYREHVASGASEAEARRLALAELDESDVLSRRLAAVEAPAVLDPPVIGDPYRGHQEQRVLVSLGDRGRDLRYAVRALRQSPAFSLVVLIVLAIGTGAVTSVFALLNTIVLQPLPYPESNRLVVVKHAAPGLNRAEVGMSSGLYFHYRQHAQSLQSLAVYSPARVLNLRVPGSGTERVQVTNATSALFRVLGARPILGRLFVEADWLPAFAQNGNLKIPVLMAQDLWVADFGGDPDIVGKTITINDSPGEVVGVLPEGFAFPDSHTKIWMLFELQNHARATFAQTFPLNAIARLRPGATAGSAQAELAHLLPQIEGVYRDATPRRMAEVRLAPIVMPLKSAVIGDVAHVLLTLFGGMALLLLIAGANAAALFTVRAEHRRREIAVRQALGADRRHVARLFVTEALVLTTFAAALGLFLAKGVLWGVIAMAPVALPRTGEVALGGMAIAFAAGLAVLMAVFYGALSVRPYGRALTASLLGGGHWATGHRGGPSGRDPFVVLQVALALALMVGSALMVRTYLNLSRTALGFATDQVLTAEVSLPYKEADQHVRIYTALVERIRRLPGVEHASAASFVPLTGTNDVYPVQLGAPPIPFKFFVPGYFQAMGTPILSGESFAPGEHVTAALPVLVSAALARRLYPGESAIGQTVRRLNEDGSVVDMGSGPTAPFTIVGVVGDVRETTLRSDPTEIVYIPLIEPAVEPSIVPTDVSLVIRVAGAPLTLAAAVRHTIAEVDPGLSVGQVRTMDSIVSAARSREAFVGVLLLVAAAVSLFLGVVGIYGSVAHVVKRRTREIGIRLALGARPAEVIQNVVMGSLGAVFVGAALGLVIAFAGTGMLSALLFGVAPRDPFVILAVTGVLLSAAAAAALLAARGAARIAPLLAMRID
jgi:putative ABC transport system permease protein